MTPDLGVDSVFIGVRSRESGTSAGYPCPGSDFRLFALEGVPTAVAPPSV